MHRYQPTPTLARRRLPLAILALTLPLALPIAATAQEQAPAAATEQQQYQIPSGSLEQALNALGQQAGIVLVFSSELVRGQESAGLNGRYSLDDALQQLLAGSGLGYRFTGQNSVTLTAKQEGDGTLQLAPLEVMGEAVGGSGPVEGLRAETSGSATNVDAPLIETPATVNVLTRDFLDAIGARSLEDTLQYVPGASPQTLNSTGTAFNIRGFQSEVIGGGARGGDAVRIGGFRPVARRYHFDPALYERIDFLKGGSSLLYGTAVPGGMVNFVTKRPEFERRTRVEGSLGSFDTSRLTFDSTGPVNEEETVAYRLVATALNSNQNVHGDNDDRSFDDRLIFNPQLAWRLPGGGSLRASYEYSQLENASDVGIKRLVDGSYTFNTQPFIGPDSSVDRENHIGTLEYNQPLSETWAVNVGAAFGTNSYDGLWDSASGNPDENNELRRRTRRFAEDADGREVRAELKGDFNTGGWMRHQLTVGANYQIEESTNRVSQAFSSEPIDALNPVFGPALDTAPFGDPTENEVEDIGVYIQDFVSIGGNVTVFGGLRYTDAQSVIAFSSGATEGADEAIDYTVGAIYNHSNRLNPFVSYSTALTPQRGALSGSGDPVPFREGEQIEVGLKSEWLDDRLATTLSLYDIKQTNISEGDPDNPGFVVLVGDQRSRGLEFEAVGDLTDQISVIGGYSYLDAEFTSGASEGNSPKSVPEQEVSLFGQYEFLDELKGWRAGLGVTHVGQRQGDNANSFKLPNYERVDAFIGYQHGGADVRVSIENVLNENYVSGTDGFGNFAQGAPRFFTATVGFEF